MQQINYNQNFLFPAVYPGYAPPVHQQPISGLGLGHMYDMPSFNQSWLPFASYIQSAVPIHQPIKQEATVKQEVESRPSEHSPYSANENACKYATATSNERRSLPGIDVFNSWSSCSRRNTATSQQSDVHMSHVGPSPDCRRKTDRLSHSDIAESSLKSCSHITTPSSSRQLRLPNVNASSSFAANVMSEESDVGYYSLSDGQSDISPGAPECGFDISTGSDDVFGDVDPKLPDFIDDVLNDICEPDENATGDEPAVKRQRLSSPPPPTTTVQQHVFQSYSIPPNTFVLSTITRDAANTNNNHPNRETKHTKQPSTHKDLYCSICYKHFQNKTNLKVHVRMHTDVRPHQCSFCDKSFAQKSTLRTHIRTHTGQRPYKCDECARAFSDYSTYRKHVRIHTGQKPYTCDVCQKSFAQSGNMIRHRDIHYRKTSKTITCS